MLPTTNQKGIKFAESTFEGESSSRMFCSCELTNRPYSTVVGRLHSVLLFLSLKANPTSKTFWVGSYLTIQYN